MSMPFGLMSAGATYQRYVQNFFHKQIRCNVHAYVDDIMVKSQKKQTLLADLKETFDNLGVYPMKLNLAKCVFGVPAGKLLGIIVSEQSTKPAQKRLRLSRPYRSQLISTLIKS